MKKYTILFTCLFLILGQVHAQNQASEPRPITWQDIPSWKSINLGTVQLSPDGQWMVHVMGMVEGDSELILQKTSDPNVKKTFMVGSSSFPSISFAENGKWLAFKEYPTDKERKAAAKSGGKGLKEKLTLIDLSNDYKKTSFENVGSFNFNGTAATHLAINLNREGSNGDAKGSDLVLLHLASGKKQNIGNVTSFGFNKSGTYLAYAVDAANQVGNGIYLLTLSSGKTEVLDSDAATYRSISWTEDGGAFALLKMVKDKKYKQDHGKVIGVKNLNAPQVTIYDPQKDSVNFSSSATISPNKTPIWSNDLNRLFFGVHALVPEKKEPIAETSPKSNKDSLEKVKLQAILADTTVKSLDDLKKAIAKTTASSEKSIGAVDGTKPDMTIWHWKDSRLQSRQQVLENQDKMFNTYAMYDVSKKQFVSLQDSSFREMTLLPKHQFGLGLDLQAYELDINLDGQNYRDIYTIDLNTGEKNLIFEKFYLPTFASLPRPSPDGTKLLLAKDGHFHVYDIPSKELKALTTSINVSFVDEDNDRNVTLPMHSPIGWSADSKFVLLRDGWDIWQVPVTAGRVSATNITQNGRKDKIRYQSRFVLDREEKGIDLSKAQYFAIYGEWTKKSGIARVEGGKSALVAGPQALIWEDAAINRFTKAKNAEVYYLTKERFAEPTNVYLTDASISKLDQLSQNAPDVEKYTWSSGARLVDYVSDKGDTLQAALFLPANYTEGQQYPTIVYYYEKLSQTLHSYSNPGFSGTGWNPAVYTSNGYAVLIPDIVYQMDDPGMSAVWCVLPAVKEALKTGVIDESKMGLHGHSWGGYQTSFLITQTNQFKAAAAGAPLTNMVSMYDLIYWNTGGGNMSIFESSQGRFRGAPWENWDAYHRNSPVYHVKNVETPLLMLHNDKDGAVDFTQGIEYYNALRRLKKPVIMVQYKGENHGLSKLENRKDYSVRMLEFFDFHLKGKNENQWINSGVSRLDLDEHLSERTFSTNQY
ncbi:S9 family peptidase [Mongoliitalea daihaiensis]|uniref:S9 family peptidase n=1 Tax=Mongoliitalea daihaiensis TaxID=2782006 RepID=UPI001F2FAC18|nr:prolyl oligopeptidase family serine peptidase [Mongoliitalea daihaiensis]UJP63739.1 S9 family peptidase [Mongoliitalea daihaiensis]